MLYHPAPNEAYRRPEDMPEGYRNPREKGMQYEDVYITTRDKVKIHAWLVKAGAAYNLSRTIIFFHGNAGNIGARNPNIEQMVKRLYSNVLMVDYRGYGNSEGTPTEDGLRLDAEASLEYLLNRDDIDKERIYVFGRSLGGAVGAELAAGKYGSSLKGLILENTFTSISELVDKLMPMVAIFKTLI
jgi:pimeloyl-ACP methyl ester carboxylesterase